MINKIKEELKKAMLEKNDVAKGALRMLISNISVAEKSKGVCLDDSGVISCVEKEIKTVEEQIQLYANDEEKKNLYEKQKEILIQFLPEQMDEFTVCGIIDEILLNKPDDIQGGKAIGYVMKEIGAMFTGKFNRSRLSELIKERI